MKKSVVLFLLALVLTSSFVMAGSTSSIRRTFVVSEEAVSNEAVFMSPEEVAQGNADKWDVFFFVVGGIVILIVLIVIIKSWLGKKPRKKIIRKIKKTNKRKK